VTGTECFRKRLAPALTVPALAALAWLLAAPALGLAAGEIPVVTADQLYADFEAYNEKYAAMSFDEKKDLYIVDVPTYRGKRMKITVSPWKIARSMRGIPQALVKQPVGPAGEGWEMKFYFFFDQPDMESLKKVMRAVLEGRPVTITATLGMLDDADLWFRDCVVE